MPDVFWGDSIIEKEENLRREYSINQALNDRMDTLYEMAKEAKLCDKYCPIGKVECGRFSPSPTNSLSCEVNGCFYNLYNNEVCRWPSKQVPVKKGLVDRILVHISHPISCSHCKDVLSRKLSSIVECPEPEDVTETKLYEWVPEWKKELPLSVWYSMQAIKALFAGIHREAKERNHG